MLPLTLEVDHDREDNNGRDEVHDVGQILAVESLAESKLLVGPGDEKVNKSDNGTLELRATTSVDSGRGESAPDNGLANVGRDEERDTAAKTVALLEELVKEDDNQGGSEKLDDEENADSSTEIGGQTVKTSQDENASLAERQDDGEELLRGLVELAVGLEVKVDIDEVGAGQQLEDHAGGDDRGDTQLHQSTPVTGQHHTKPVQGVRRVGGDDTVQRHLTHDQEDEKSQLKEESDQHIWSNCANGEDLQQHTPVHISFWLKGTLVSGAATSGRRGVKGLIKSRKRTVDLD